MLDPAPPRRPSAPLTVPLVPTLVVAVFIVVGAVALRRTMGSTPAGTSSGADADAAVGADTLDRASRGAAHDGDAGPTQAAATTSYTVAPGDTLSLIAARFGTSVASIMSLNGISNPDALVAGQELTVQAPVQGEGPDIPVLPDAELVYGPDYAGFDVAAWTAARGGALATWSEEVNGEALSGPEIVARVVEEFSVGPRALLAVVEAKSGIVSGAARSAEAAEYPAGLVDPVRHGLWLQLNWLADRLNGGYYDQATRGSPVLTFGDGVRLTAHPALNAGSVAVQRVLGLQSTPDALPGDIAGVLAAYEALFGAVPATERTDRTDGSEGSEGARGTSGTDTASRTATARTDGTRGRDRSAGLRRAFPPLTLPFARGETWWLTGGPHGGWGDGSAWAAIDFVPDEEPTGCATSAAWVTAAADGVVVPGGTGQVILDLDGGGADGQGPADGDRRTGPVLFHLHLAAEGRVAAGSRVRAGDRLGHPSCEGGFSNATHVHIARLYDGEWLAAAGTAPFDLGGWTAYGSPRVYDGGLKRADGEDRAACECRSVGGNDVRW